MKQTLGLLLGLALVGGSGAIIVVGATKAREATVAVRINAARDEGRDEGYGQPRLYDKLRPGNFQTEIVVDKRWGLAIVRWHGPYVRETGLDYVVGLPEQYLVPGARFKK